MKPYLLLTILCYLIGAFVAGTFDPAKWDSMGKVFLVVGWLAVMVAVRLEEK